MRIVLIGLGALVVLLVAAIFAAPSFVDWNSHKALIAKEARKFTGRALAIDGDVSLALLPAPALSAKGVRLANIDGGSEAAMMRLEALRVRVALMPLLRGKIQVVSVSLVNPTILLEVLADRRRNWDFATPGQASGDGASGDASGSGGPAVAEPAAGDGDGGDFTVQVDSFEVENGTLIYRNAARGQEERVEALHGQIVAETLRGPFALKGRARLRGVETAFDLALGRLIRSGATPLNFEVTLPRAGARTSFSGSLSLDPQPVGLRGRLKSEGANLASVLAVLPGRPQALPAFLGNSYALDTAVSSDLAEAKASELSLRLGTTSLSGDARVTFGPPMDAALRLVVSRLDLDRLLADAAAPAVAPQGGAAGASSGGAPAAGPEPQMPAQAFALPDDLSGSANITVDALVYRGQVVRQLRVNLAMDDGRLSVNQALALLPGGSDLSIAGSVSNSEAGPQFDGYVEAASDNLRGVFDWLSLDVTSVPADRLRKMSFSSRVQASARQINLSDIDLRLDVSRLAGGMVIAVRERLGLGIGLSLDGLNLDAYLPPRGAAATASGSGAAQDGAGPTTNGAQAPRATAATAFGEPFDAFDANINLRVGSLRWRGEVADSLHLEGTLQNGTLTVRDARVGDLAGSSLRYVGSLADLGPLPSFDGTLELTVADPTRLARTLGIETATLDRVGPFSMAANVRGKPDNFGFNSKLAILDGRFSFAGTAQLPGGPPHFDLTLEAAHPDPVRLARTFIGPLDLAEGLGPMDLKARLAGGLDAVTVSGLDGRLGPLALAGGFALELGKPQTRPSNIGLDVALRHDDLAALARQLGLADGLSASLGAVDLKGRLGGDAERLTVSELSGTLGPLALAGSLAAAIDGEQPQLDSVNLNLHLRHPNLAELVRALGGAGPGAAAALGAVDVTGHLAGDARALTLDQLAGRLGDGDLSGRLSVALAGRPLVTADLRTGTLPLHLLFADNGAGIGAGSGAGSGGAGNAGEGSLSPRWSREPIDLSALQDFDADVTLRSAALLFDKLQLEQAELRALLNEGRIDLRRLAGLLHQGRVEVAGSAETARGIEADLTLTAKAVQLGPLLSALADFERVTGPVDLDAKLQTSGSSEAELVEGLNGGGTIAGSLRFRTSAEEQIGNALLNLLGEKVKEIRGLTDASNVLFSAFGGAPATLSGSFSADQGVLRTVDTRLDGRDASALTHATIGLPAWQINSRTDVFRAQDSSNPYLTATLSGSLDEPNTRVSGVPLQRSQQTAPSAGSQPGGSSTDGRTVDPKDLLKNLLKGLGNN